MYCTIVDFKHKLTKIVNISNNIHLAKNRAYEYCVNYICDEIGKNNFTDTLDEDDIDKLPLGLCAVRDKDTQYISEINIIKVSEKSGWMSKYKDIEEIAKVRVIMSENTNNYQSELSHTCANSNISSTANLENTVLSNQDKLMKELKMKLEERNKLNNSDDDCKSQSEYSDEEEKVLTNSIDNFAIESKNEIANQQPQNENTEKINQIQ